MIRPVHCTIFDMFLFQSQVIEVVVIDDIWKEIDVKSIAVYESLLYGEQADEQLYFQGGLLPECTKVCPKVGKMKFSWKQATPSWFSTNPSSTSPGLLVFISVFLSMKT